MGWADRLFGAVLVSSVGLSGCGDDDGPGDAPESDGGIVETLTVAATADPSSGSAPLAVAFDCSADGGAPPVSVTWDFGDGSSALGGNPGYTYRNPGSYTARCVAMDAEGQVAIAPVPVTVATSSMPVAVASARFTGRMAPLEVSFTGSATGGDGTLTYEWHFGDGGSSTEQNPVHVYEASGLYSALLTVTDADGDAGTARVTIEVVPTNGAPTAVIDLSPGDCVAPLQEVYLDAADSADPEGAALRYDWRFVRVPPGSHVAFNDPTIANPTFRPSQEGEYELRVFISDGTTWVASSSVTITASGPSILAAVSGGGQSAAVREPYASPLVVRVLNGCGLPVEDVRPALSGTNALVTFPPPTDDSGETAFGATAGSRAAPATVLARVDSGASAAFDLTVTAGPPARIVVDPVSFGSAGDPAGMALTFRVTDELGNPTSATESTFDICAAGEGEVSFDAPDAGVTCKALETTGGATSATLFASVPGPVELSLSGPDAGMFDFGGWLRLLETDFEASDPRFVPGRDLTELEAWERGTPTVGPTACAGGSSCFGTDLDGNYVPTTSSAMGVSFLELPPPGGPLPGSFGPIQRVEVTQDEWFDVPNTSTGQYGCLDEVSQGGAFAISIGPPGPGMHLVPLRGFDLLGGCMLGLSAGTSGGWVTETYFSPNRRPLSFDSLFWILLRDQSTTTGAGWYIDNVAIDVLFLDDFSVLFTGG